MRVHSNITFPYLKAPAWATLLPSLRAIAKPEMESHDTVNKTPLARRLASMLTHA
jgi:hypothetical protein